jgi:hypothetical protein
VSSYSGVVSTAPPLRLPWRLHAVRPESVALLQRINQRVWTAFDTELLDLLRMRIARRIGNEAVTRGHVVAESQLEDARVEFAEQFVLDVSRTTPESLDALGSAFDPDRIPEFVRAVYVIEFTQRLQLLTQALLDPVPCSNPAAVDHPVGAVDEVSLHDLLAAYQESVVRGSVVDRVTTELVRLRCARTHNCRICQTLRLADAQAAGADEAMTAKIDRYEESDLPPRAKVALRLTDAFITGVGAPPEQLRRDARRYFTQAELASLCLDITKWSTQKINVALGTDGADGLPVNEAGISYFDFDDSGRVAGFRAS